MTLLMWRNLLHKLITVTGFVALIAVVSGANVKSSNYDLALTLNLLKPQIQSPSPLLTQQCENLKSKNDVLWTSSDNNKQPCYNKEVDHEKYNTLLDHSNSGIRSL